MPVVLRYDYYTNPLYSSNSNQVWLNNNLGAEYTRVGSLVFDPGQQAKEHNDYNAFGSLWQFGRPADGHELVTYTNATTWQFKYSTTTTPTTTYPPQPTENQTVIPTVTADTVTGIDTTSMWFAGLSFSSFPITMGNDNNAVCPYGFVLPNPSYLHTIINKSKPFDNMKDFFLRLPSNPKNVTNVGDNGTYAYGPKLWTEKVGYQNRYNSGSTARSQIALNLTTDYYWDPIAKGWTDYNSAGNLLTPGSWEYISSGRTSLPKHIRKIVQGTSFSFSGNLWVGAAADNNVGVTRTINDSYAIRCIKQ